MPTICRVRSSQWFGASEPTSRACCPASGRLCSSEPISDSTAFTALAPSDTAKTAKISHRISHGGGGRRLVSLSAT